MIHVTLSESGQVLDIYDDANGNVPAGAVPVEVDCDLQAVVRFDWLEVEDGVLRYTPPPAASK